MLKPAIFYVLLLFSACLSAQKLYFNHLTVNSGLSQGVNNCIYRDSRGFVWISSYDGLNRFDGIHCRVYRTLNDSTGLQGTLFLNILEDKTGNVWVGSNEGLNKYIRSLDAFENYSPPSSISTDKFYSPFYIDNKGNVWVQSGNKLLVFNASAKVFSLVKMPAGANSFVVKVANKKPYEEVKTIYLASKNGPVIWTGELTGDKLDWSSLKLSLADTRLTALLPGSTKGELFVGTNTGVYRVDQNANTIQLKGTEDCQVSALHADAQQNLWIGTLQHGLIKATITGWRIEYEFLPKPLNDKSIAGAQVQFVTTDRQENLWVSLWGKGVDYTSLLKNKFEHYLSADEVAAAGADNYIRSVIAVNNELWCATQSSGIIILDSSKKIVRVLKTGLPPSAEHLLLCNNKVFVCTLSGLFAIDILNRNIERVFAGEFASIQFNYACLLNEHTLLLAANDGLYAYDFNKNNRVPKRLSKDRNVYLTCYRDSNGLFYISEPFKGFSMVKIVHDSIEPVKTVHLNASVKSFVETDSIIWVGTTSGLVMFDRKRRDIKRIFSVSDGLSNQYVYGILPYKNDLWISSNAGINRFSTIDFSVKSFTAKYGLQSNEFNTYAYCITKQGEFIFGGINGLNGFYPGHQQNEVAAPQLALTGLLVNDSAYRTPVNFSEIDSLRLKYWQNTISLQFTAIDFSSPLDDIIRYKLSGYDKQWITGTNNALIRYANLPAGKYQLMVSTINYDGIEANNKYLLNIYVETPWWQSWWFILLVLSAISLSVVIFIRSYIRRKLARQKLILEKDIAIEQERNRMAQDLHDGLGGMLSGIKHSLSAVAIAGDQQIDRSALLSKSINMLDSTIGELRRVAFNMMPESMLRFGIDATIRDYCYDLSVNAGVQVVFQSYGLSDWHPAKEVAVSIYRIIQELVSNSLRHANASQVIVQLIKSEKELSITVEDNGIGFDIALLSRSKGMGWNNLRARVAALKSRIDIHSVAGKGTTVTINLALQDGSN